jgi:hypothetical protein
MADKLFTYQGQQSVVNVQSPTIDIKPDLRAASAFEGLQKVVQGGLQLKAQMNKVEAATAEEAQKVADEKAASDALMQLNAAYTATNKSIDLYNNDPQKMGEAEAAWRAFQEQTFESVNDAVRYKIDATFFQLDRAVSSKFGKVGAENKKRTAMDIVNPSLALLNVLPAKEQKQKWTELHDYLVTEGGMARQDAGSYIMKQVGAQAQLSLAGQLDKLQQGDYTPLLQFRQTIDNMREIDPKLKPEDLLAFENTYNQFKNQVDSSIRSNVSNSMLTKDQATFTQNIKLGLENGVYSPEQAQLEVQKFFKKSESEIKNDYLATLSVKTGGQFDISEQPSEIQPEAAKAVKTDLNTKMRNGTLTAQEIKFHSGQNSTVYKNVLEERVRDLQGQFIALSGKDLKDAEVKETLNGLLQETQKLNSYNIQGIDSSLALTSQAIPFLLSQGAVAQIPIFLQSLKDTSKVMPANKNEKVVKELLNELPEDAHNTALKEFAIARTALGDSKAMEFIIDSHKVIKIEDTNLKMSQQALAFFSDLKLTTENLKSLPEVLSLDPSLPDSILQILDNPEVKVSIEPFTQNLVFVSGDGFEKQQVTIALSEVDKQELSRDVQAAFIKNNPLTVTGVLVDKAGESVMEGLRVLDKALYLMLGENTPIGLVTDTLVTEPLKSVGNIRNTVVAETIKYTELAAEANKIIGMYLAGEYTLTEAVDKMNSYAKRQK